MAVVKFIQPASGNPFDLPVMDVSGITRKFLDISYTPEKPHPDRLLDIYLPESGDGPFPTLVCIHGGAFSGGSKNDVQVAAYMEGLTEGFAVVSVEQRLCKNLPDGTNSKEGVFPNPLIDFKAAIRFLRANAAEYKLDHKRFAACGGSAGGYHATMAALTGDIPALYDNSLGWVDVSDSIAAAVDWFGVGDLVVQSNYTDTTPMKMPDGTEFKLPNYADIFLGAKCQEHTNLALFANPESWVTPGMPPIYKQTGASDEIVPVECSRNLVRKIEEIAGSDKITYDEFPDYTHGDARFSDPENIKRVLEWLKEKLV